MTLNSAIVVVIMLVSSTKLVVGGMEECPPWFRWVNGSDVGGYCV